MLIKIEDITKGIFRLPMSIDNQDGRLKIGIKSIGCWVGFYNIYEEQTCQKADNSQEIAEITEFKIKPGLYTFKEISRTLRKKVEGLNLALNKITGLIDLSLPENIDVWLPSAVKYMIGLEDDNKWLRGNYDGDKPVEFLPAGGISIHLVQLSTTNNIASKSNNLVNSNLLGNIPMLSENFGQYFSVQYDNPTFVDLEAGQINQLEFNLKQNWRNGVQHTLNNHTMPISLELEIK